ncbi:hypothetical protein BT69DRAFT_253988 [Atractiella rhizophila]|nr:hypothetical protein BT69DRAFT_253988 [Atractiella rhizophila]
MAHSRSLSSPSPPSPSSNASSSHSSSSPAFFFPFPLPVTFAAPSEVFRFFALLAPSVAGAFRFFERGSGLVLPSGAGEGCFRRAFRPIL